MNRRDLIKYTAMATGAAVCTPVLSTLLAGCGTAGVEKQVDYDPKFFSENDFLLVRDLVDIILPKTESPAASEVGVDKTIDHMVANVYRPDEMERFAYKFKKLTDYLYDIEFMDLNLSKKVSSLKDLDISNTQSTEEAKSGLLELKQLTVAFYLSTEEIAKNYLNYLPVPGTYEACISLDAVDQKAWAI